MFRLLDRNLTMEHQQSSKLTLWIEEFFPNVSLAAFTLPTPSTTALYSNTVQLTVLVETQSILRHRL